MEVPCKTCIVYAACRAREMARPKHFFDGDGKWPDNSVIQVAWNEDCKPLLKFIEDGWQEDINRARDLFDMEPVK